MQNFDIIHGGLRWEKDTDERMKQDLSLERYGYKVYSQNDEDGIIEEIFRRIGCTNKKFVEFGIQDGLESNCHYLLFQNWTGLWIEGDEQYYKLAMDNFENEIIDGVLKIEHSFITKDNINSIIESNGFVGEIDLISIDIDGNDYYIWETIDVVEPRVVVIEYNAKFPPTCDWKIPYQENFVWDGTDNFGASLKALEILGKQKGYCLVGTNFAGTNAFFVKKELCVNENLTPLFLKPYTAEKLYNPARYDLKHISGHPTGYCVRKKRKKVYRLTISPFK